MSSKGGELRGLSQWVQLYTGAQINFGNLTSYSALVYELKCGGRGGVAGSQPMSTAVDRIPNKLRRSYSIFNPWAAPCCILCLCRPLAPPHTRAPGPRSRPALQNSCSLASECNHIATWGTASWTFSLICKQKSLTYEHTKARSSVSEPYSLSPDPDPAF